MSESHPSGSRIAYEPALDGLRAFAVAAVLVYHQQGVAGSDSIGHGGFIGVDIFFVLSGYLITALLLAEHTATGAIALGSFWIRRLRRLAPALLLMVVLTAILARTVYSDRLAALVRDDLPWVLTYLKNWHGSIESPFSHTWSLAVEEQWYLVWPLVFLGVLRIARNRRGVTTAIVAALSVASALWGWFLFERYGLGRAFFGTDVRAQQLLLGATLAVAGAGGAIVMRRWVGATQVAGAVALAGLVAIVLFAHDGTGWFPFGRFVLAGIVVVVIVAAVQPRGAVRWLLALPPLIAIGRISYGIYLFHFPLFRWLDAPTTGVHGASLFALRVAATLVVATLSFVFVEQPIRRGWLPNRALVPIGVVMAVMLLVVTRVGVADAIPRPRSPLLARYLPEFASKGPPGAPHVLAVGGRRADLLSATTLHQPALEGDDWVLAIGDPACGLTTPERACRAFSDDLFAISKAFRSDTVVLMLDEKDLAELGPRKVAVVVARLDEIGKSVGYRRIVVMTLPCNTKIGPLVDRVNGEVAAWAARHHVRTRAPAGVPCATGTTITSPTRAFWGTVLGTGPAGTAPVGG